MIRNLINNSFVGIPAEYKAKIPIENINIIVNNKL